MSEIYGIDREKSILPLRSIEFIHDEDFILDSDGSLYLDLKEDINSEPSYNSVNISLNQWYYVNFYNSVPNGFDYVRIRKFIEGTVIIIIMDNLDNATDGVTLRNYIYDDTENYIQICNPVRNSALFCCVKYI